MDMTGEFVVITGATSGIGWTYAREFARRGARLLLCGRRRELLERRRDEALATGAGSAETLAGDLGDEQVVGQLLSRLASEDAAVLVNNAGFGHSSPVADAAEAELRRMLRVQAEVPLRLIRVAAAGMSRRGSGLIVNVGSLAGRAAVPGSAVYVSTKIYLERLSETLALELAGHGVVVQALTPGYVRTDFHRDVKNIDERRRNRGLVRWMEPEDVVRRSLAVAERAERTLRRHPGRVLRKNVVVIPGLANRVLGALSAFVPRTLVYRAATSRKPV